MNQMGQIGFVFGILGFFCFPFSIIAVVLFYMDKNEDDENFKYGKTGAILGFINITIVALLTLASFIFGLLPLCFLR